MTSNRAIETPHVDHWSELAKRWQLSGPPLRVGRDDVEGYADAVKRWTHASRAPRVLLLGVTPELYAMDWPPGTDFLAVDRAQAMIDCVWPGPRERVRCEDWTALSLPDASCDLALCDGGFHLLSHPGGQADLVRSLRRVLAGGGLCVLRLFVPPARAESPDAVLRDLLAGRIASVDALKLRLGMALQRDARAGVALARVWDVFERAVPDPEAAQAAIGWPVDRIRSMDAYRGAASRYHFVSVEQVRQLFCVDPGGFEVESLRIPGYELGERCPVLALRRGSR
jgi:SAM-dependent methyltransferase